MDIPVDPMEESGVGIAILAAFLLTVVVLASRESLLKRMETSILGRTAIHCDSTRGDLIVRSPEYLSGVRLSFAGRDTLLEGSDTKVEFIAPACSVRAMDWS